ncbi:MAG TPA: threonine/serine exporter family protein, partial [Candidatus Saccharimonadales bacterium]|nr:threonine/serine exporter family protein [Candidatus Saccharimonadales bacterium]
LPVKSLFRFYREGKNRLEEMDGPFAGNEKIGENLTPNMRALRLAMTASDLLLSMGIPASSVVTKALDITETYCKRPVHIDISYNLIMLSQIRGIENEPLTLIRPVAMRDTNYMTVNDVQHLIYEIRLGKHSLDEAEVLLDKILKKPVAYPTWLIPLANAALAAGVDLMFTTNWRIILMTFVIVWLVDRMVFSLAKRAVPTFFRQAVAGAFVTLAAAIINLLALRGVDFFSGMNPTIIVVGGIIMLLAGLAIVGAIQDAIEEYYITANARIMRVALLTSGIVMGVLIGLYMARKIGIGIAVNPNPLSLTGLHFQVIGGAIVAGMFAIATQTRLRAVFWAGILGALALVVLYSARHLGISSVPASGVAALLVGLCARLFSRMWQTPTSGIIGCGIVPLVPGLSLYTALMQLVNYPPGDPLFYRGLGTLFTAVAIALSIAAGASFGSLLGRPFDQRRSHLRNFVPFAEFMRRQLRADGRHQLAGVAALQRVTERFDLSRYDDEDDTTDDTESSDVLKPRM